MEPLHLTEFASERYFDKLRQNDRNGHGHGHAENGTGSGSGSIAAAAAAAATATSTGTTTGTSQNSQIGSLSIPLINHEPSPLEAATFNLPSRQRSVTHESLAFRPSDQRKRSLGHDLTTLRTQRRPSFSGSLGALRSRVNITHRAPSIVETQPGIIQERIERQR